MAQPNADYPSLESIFKTIDKELAAGRKVMVSLKSKTKSRYHINVIHDKSNDDYLTFTKQYNPPKTLESSGSVKPHMESMDVADILIYSIERHSKLELDTKQSYVTLIDLLVRIINANKGYSTSEVSNGNRLYDAHCLANKFVDHVLTLLYISHGTYVNTIPSFKFDFIDSASIDIIARAAFESFLVFHHVYFSPSTEEDKDFRYLCYKIAGVSDRQDIPITSKEHEKKIAGERALISELYDKLKSNDLFVKLTEKQQRQILKGKWRLLSWKDIAKDAGFGEMIANHIYKYLSGHAHSSWLSILQTSQATLNGKNESFVNTSMDFINAVMARMIMEYTSLFPKVRTVLDSDDEARKTVEAWIIVGSKLA